MADLLEKIDIRIAALQSQQAAIQTELDELQTAARVARRLGAEGKPAATQKHPRGKRKPARPKIRDLAMMILTEKGEAHFGAVADEALSRGYKGRKNATVDKIRKSFWSTMNRDKDTFIPTGGGKYKLKEK